MRYGASFFAYAIWVHKNATPKNWLIYMRVKGLKDYNVSNRSWGYRPLRKLEVQSYLTFHSLLDNRRITEKLFTEQTKEFSEFIPS